MREAILSEICRYNGTKSDMILLKVGIKDMPTYQVCQEQKVRKMSQSPETPPCLQIQQLFCANDIHIEFPGIF
jgi:hypothetical protein